MFFLALDSCGHNEHYMFEIPLYAAAFRSIIHLEFQVLESLFRYHRRHLLSTIIELQQ